MQSSTALQISPVIQPPLKPKRTNHNAISSYPWTDKNVAYLQHISSLGSAAPSMRRVAIELFGTELARSAVAGKMFRMGLCKKVTKVQRAAKRAAPQRQKSSKHNNPTRFGPQPEALARVYKEMEVQELMPPDTSFLCTLDDLAPDKCRCPIGDPATREFRFCGTPDARLPGPYCTFHSNILLTGTSTGVRLEGRKVVTDDGADFMGLSLYD